MLVRTEAQKWVTELVLCELRSFKVVRSVDQLGFFWVQKNKDEPPLERSSWTVREAAL